MYCTADEVYATAGMTSTEVPEASVNQLILGSEAQVDRITNTTYWNPEDSGTADAGGADNELEDATKTWTTDAYNTNTYCWITGGTGEGQIKKISDTGATTLTLDSDWTTNPDATSTYKILYTAQNPYIDEELRDGDNTDSIFLNKYPLVLLESAESNSVSITTANIYQYKDSGKLLLSTNKQPEVYFWTAVYPQANVFSYWWGKNDMPYFVKRYVIVCAALMTLMTQAGGTHNIPSTYSLPEGSLTIGQAYINIKGAWDMLNKEKVILEKSLVRYTSFA